MRTSQKYRRSFESKGILMKSLLICSVKFSCSFFHLFAHSFNYVHSVRWHLIGMGSMMKKNCWESLVKICKMRKQFNSQFDNSLNSSLEMKLKIFNKKKLMLAVNGGSTLRFKWFLGFSVKRGNYKSLKIIFKIF